MSIIQNTTKLLEYTTLLTNAKNEPVDIRLPLKTTHRFLYHSRFTFFQEVTLIVLAESIFSGLDPPGQF